MRHALVLAFALLTMSTLPARAVTILAHNEGYDAGTDSFQFRITFSAVPDFVTRDSFGRPKDEFQYWITWALHSENTTYPYGNPDVVIRGGEISAAGIPIRNATGPSEPGSGGWGPIRGTVPYTQTNETIRFNVPRAILGDSDGLHTYYLGVFRFGADADARHGISDSGPVPAVSETWGGIKALYR